MAQKILIKKSTIEGKVPTPAQLDIGELAVNTADAQLYTKHSDGTVKPLVYRFYTVYSWKLQGPVPMWQDYSATVTNVAGALRITNNTASRGDAAVRINVQAGVRYMVRADLKELGPGVANKPVMHLGSRFEEYGDYGFEFQAGQGHPIVAKDDLIVIYIEMKTGGLGSWAEFSEISITEVPL